MSVYAHVIVCVCAHVLCKGVGTCINVCGMTGTCALNPTTPPSCGLLPFSRQGTGHREACDPPREQPGEGQAGLQAGLPPKWPALSEAAARGLVAALLWPQTEMTKKRVTMTTEVLVLQGVAQMPPPQNRWCFLLPLQWAISVRFQSFVSMSASAIQL